MKETKGTVCYSQWIPSKYSSLSTSKKKSEKTEVQKEKVVWS